MDRRQRYLALPTAASVVHIQLAGTPPDASAPIEMRRTLEDVAHSLASLARIYSMDELSGVVTEIPAGELIDVDALHGQDLRRQIVLCRCHANCRSPYCRAKEKPSHPRPAFRASSS